MPSEREIRKLYVNGRTICIEFYFAYFKFQRPEDAQPSPKVAILETWGGLSLNKHFGRCNPVKIQIPAALDFLRSLPAFLSPYTIIPHFLSQYEKKATKR